MLRSYKAYFRSLCVFATRHIKSFFSLSKTIYEKSYIGYLCLFPVIESRGKIDLIFCVDRIFMDNAEI